MKTNDYLPCEAYLNRGEADAEGFVLFQDIATKLFYFAMLNQQSELLWRSEGYPNEEVRMIGINSVKQNRDTISNYGITQKDGHISIALFAKNFEEIARSCWFSSKEEAKKRFPSAFPNDSFKQYLPYLLTFLAGLLLPLFYCLFTDSCEKTIIIREIDTVFVTKPCPIYDKVIDTSYIHFDFGKSQINLNLKNKQTLEELVSQLKKDTTTYVLLRGYTDNVGSYTYNVQLSEKRVQAVKDYLMNSVPKEKIILLEGLGKRYPMMPNTDSVGRGKNRRVVINLYRIQTNTVQKP